MWRIYTDERKPVHEYRLLLSNPRKVEELLREVDDTWVDQFDFSTGEPFKDDPYICAKIDEYQGIATVWKVKTTDGVDAYFFVAVDIGNGVITIDYKIVEPESLTMLRAAKPLLDRKLREAGIDLPETRSIKEYRDLLRARLPRSNQRSEPG